jgi:hypothetical protein
MKRGVLSAIGIASVSVGCDLLVGIGDLPQRDAGGSSQDVAIEDVAPNDSLAADTSADIFVGDATFGDGSVRDRAIVDGTPSDRLGVDGGREAADADDETKDQTTPPPDARDTGSDRRPIPDAKSDRSASASSCPLDPGDGGMAQCIACLQSQCCAPLAACEQPDDAGLSDAGESQCIQLTNITLICIVGVNDPSANCTGATRYSPSVQQDTTALVACVQQSCPTECPAIAAIPGI